jgi:choline kinase
MKALILGAGRGSRLGDITVKQPKPLAILAGKPLLEWQIGAFKEAGIDDVSLVTGYQKSAFDVYQLPTFTNHHWATSNMVSSLLCADSLLSNNDTIISYGDIVYRPSIVQKLIASPCSLGITYDKSWLDLWNLRFENPLDDAERFQHSDGYLQAIGDKVTDLGDINGQYMGLLKISTKSWQDIKAYLLSLPADELQKKDMTSLLSELLRLGMSITTVAINGGWVEVDNPSDISCYEQQLTQTTNWLHDWREEY